MSFERIVNIHTGRWTTGSLSLITRWYCTRCHFHEYVKSMWKTGGWSNWKCSTSWSHVKLWSSSSRQWSLQYITRTTISENNWGKERIDDTDLTWGGRLFHRRGPATGNERLPYVDSLVRRTIKLGIDAEWNLPKSMKSSQNQINDWVHQLDKLYQSHAGTCTQEWL